jgi:hypothetical protein
MNPQFITGRSSDGSIEFFVDSLDDFLLKKYRWLLAKRAKKIYLYTCIAGSEYFLHRMITNAAHGMVVDHIDGNTLNNTRSNLRVCTQAENTRNRAKSQTASGKFKGVSFRKDIGKWRARIMINRKEISLGVFDSEVIAAKAYNDAAVIYHGVFSKLNEVD